MQRQPKKLNISYAFNAAKCGDQHAGLYTTILKVLQPSHPASLTTDPAPGS